MRHNTPVTTMAAAIALALALLVAVLLPSENVVRAQTADENDPVFPDDLDTSLEVPENTPPGTNIGEPIAATDADEDRLEFGDPLTYSLEATADTDVARAEAASFDIDPSTGQLITKAALHADGGDAKTSYSVTVRVKDSSDGDGVTTSVTIAVTGVDEPPAAPMAPTVVSGQDNSATTDLDESTTTLKVIWHAPENMGPDITDYDIEYKKTTDTSFVADNITHTSPTDTVATIADLDPTTSYQVRVRAKNGEADTTENWSLTGVGSTNKADNGAPSFDENGVGNEMTLTRRVDENEPAREEIGTEVRANAHIDDNALTYRLGGRDADLFDIDTSSGQLLTRGSLNHEDPRCYVENDPADLNDTDCDYYVTVSVFDGQGASDARPVKIEIRDRSEMPDTPARPTVRATEKSSRSLDVSWTAPSNSGPPITGYEIRYRKGTSGGYMSIQNIMGTKTTIAPPDDNLADGDDRLTPNTSYEVHVKAITPERDSAWSALTTGRTSAGNQDAIFDDRRDDEAAKTDRTIERAVNENTRAGQPVGTIIRVRNQGGQLTYKLVAAVLPNLEDFNKFAINERTGQILTKDPLNTEATCSTATDSTLPGGDIENCTYLVRVEVSDGLDEHGNKEEGDPADDAAAERRVDDRITVRIVVRDMDETPVAPKVTVTSPEVASDATEATLMVTWNRPDNAGPPITGYVVECSGAGISSSNPCPQPANPSLTANEVSYTIDGLTPNSSYSVRVRADNAEGTGTWSTSESQSTSEAGNAIPSITPPGTNPAVAENVRSGSAVGDAPVVADDSDSTGALSYEIEGPNDDLFTIDSIGQIKTKRSLNHEDPRCYDGDANPTTCTYLVRVKVSDLDKGSNSLNVTINVTDVEEPPSKPATPTVMAKADTGRSLEVTWNEPTNTGPPITAYQIAYRQYRQGTNSDAYQIIDHQSTERKVTISTIGNPVVPLEPQTQYEVQIRATNGEGTAGGNDNNVPWGDYSALRRASTGVSNVRPVFSNEDSLITLEVPENTRSGQNVGSAVEATDNDRGNRLTYTLEGPGMDSFSITSTGQIRTKSGVTYDYESRQSYSVTVKVDDGRGKDNSVATKSVTINVEDREEPPSTPSAPRVMAISGSTDSVRVTWDEPNNTGPPITDYDVQCPNCPVNISHDGVDRSMIITGLTPGTRYNVQVRAWNDEGHSDWSGAGGGSPNADVTNQRPIFSGGARTFSVEENSVVAGDPIGSAVTAVDPDLDTVTHTLEGTDATSFSIDAGSGQIRATGGLDYEEKASYSVTVKATDTRGGSATVAVRINVTDVNEPPAMPEAPTVTPTSSTSIQVNWDAPENTGPPITDYDYRYREALGAWTEVTNTTITGTTVKIDGLTPGTSYDVDVRAKNDEGTSEWSNSGVGATNAPGANNPPVFTEGASATRSVSATSPAGTNIGDPIAATDADSGDTVTYRLEGRDAPSFDINDSTGQLLTKSGIALIVGTTYTVTVVADDTKDTTRIDVSIEATAAPPNNVPVFTDGASTTRSVRDDAASGAAVGSPVTATDADAGDTITYSLEGTDAASFGIVASSGQIQTSAALDASTKSTYSVTVRATDSNGGSATIAVTITVTPRPVTFGCATNGAVSDTSNTGLISDCEALMASRNLLQGNTGRLNWSPATPINQWEGVSLRGTPSRITFLDLSSKRLDGTVPADLGRLPMLRWLNLRSNDLSGSIPSELNSLTRLERLLLHNNRLSGPIPNLSSLRSLKMLWLSGRDMALTGNLPSWLNSMSSLESLSVWGNDLSGSIPRLTGMTSLELLKLQSNNFTGGVPAWFGDMNGPAILYLHDNELTGTIPANLGRNTGVIRLWLDRNNLTGSIPAALGGMTGLRTLNLRDNQLTGTIPSELGNLGSLNQLRLHNNQLTGTIPSALANLSNVTQMWLSGNQLTGSIPTALGGMPRLRDLNLRANDLSGAIPVELGNLRDTLTRLRIGGTIQDGVETRGNTGLTGCVPRSLAGATDADDLRLAGSAGISLCP